jgi:hypothetical protein
VEPGGGIYLIARLFKGQPDKAIAIHSRREAMSRLLASSALPGWTQAATADCSIPTAEAVFSATAIEPLVLVGDHAEFDRDSFVQAVLCEAATEGRA